MQNVKTFQNCRLCRSTSIRPVFKKDALFIFKCKDCGIVFLGNELDEETIKNLYKYYAYSAFSNYLSPITKLHYERLLDFFEGYRKNNAILDVGCGAGYFMLCASNRGWNVEGTEISEEAIKLAEEKSQRVFKGDIESLDLEKEKYDIVTLFELMEHASNPEGIIRKLSYILRRGGLIYITTPNYNSLIRRILGNRWGMLNKEHLFYFTVKQLRALLKRYNFKVIKIKTENISLRELSKIFSRSGSHDPSKLYEKQEHIRYLIENRKSFFIMKRLINFILNISKIGDTIYIFAEK